MSDAKKEYCGQNIHFYRGAIDAAFREVEALDLALGLNIHEGERSRMHYRLKQLDQLVTAIEDEECARRGRGG